MTTVKINRRPVKPVYIAAAALALVALRLAARKARVAKRAHKRPPPHVSINGGIYG